MRSERNLIWTHVKWSKRNRTGSNLRVSVWQTFFGKGLVHSKTFTDRKRRRQTNIFGICTKTTKKQIGHFQSKPRETNQADLSLVSSTKTRKRIKCTSSQKSIKSIFALFKSNVKTINLRILSYGFFPCLY